MCAAYKQLMLLVNVMPYSMLGFINSRDVPVFSPACLLLLPKEQCGTLKAGPLRDYVEYS